MENKSRLGNVYCMNPISVQLYFVNYDINIVHIRYNFFKSLHRLKWLRYYSYQIRKGGPLKVKKEPNFT